MRIYRILLSSEAIAVILLLFGYGWIIGSEFFAASISNNPISLLNIQIFKGLIFVTVASSGLYGLLYLKDKELQQNHKYTNSILETIDVAIMVVTHNGIFDSVNSAFVDIFGYQKEEVVGQHFTKLLNEEDFAKGHYNFRQLMEGMPLPNEEWKVFDKSGNPKTLLINTHILQTDGKKLLITSAT
ncbi:MAG: PAS domain S-box protein, partial [Aliifodinibius sp.]|nr:PAS domain S-box protein [Fodinibius sp.]NIV09746.1 PAS domain S-box protein [Fodinibius sp.]NIY23390.1 PAS domain S-box protein [Fodinibius sp.]